MKKGQVTKKLIISYALLILWALVIFILSSEGHNASTSRSDAIVLYLKQTGTSLPTDVLTFLTRKAAHTITYFIFGILAYNTLRHYKLPTRRTILIGIAIVLGYALSDEFHQLFVPGRSGELRDVLIDTTAGTIGVALAYFAHRRIVKGRVALQASNTSKNKA